ncbi:MAG: DUF1232 domain-containing protein, partial [Prolixibacteraceae bacterium]|nr:DUF1232 domain-containing protein [Prolixibacteraceae bacterium]MBN2774023.1 DUF1232 domain-containing protein [Prolixibacteraceae bacterium]
MDDKYSKYYTKKSLWKKLKDFSKKAGQKVVFAVLLLYYAMADKSVPVKTKAMIAAALGYFILPLDAIPDFSPIIGFSDDFGVLMFAISQISECITPDVKDRAKKQMMEWFGKIEEKELSELEEQI